MRSIPVSAQLSVLAAAVLLSPALAFLMVFAVEIVIGLLVDAGAPRSSPWPLVPSAGCCFASCGAAKVVTQSRREPAR